MIINILISVLALAAMVTIGVMWIISLVQVFTRKDLKHESWLWALLIVFVTPLGTLIYFFVEDRKKYGVITLIAVAILPVIIVSYGIANFLIATQY